MTSISPCPHFVYELVDPRDNSIFYVGITIDLYARYRQHMHCDGVNPEKDKRIQEILASGHLPIMRTLEQVPNFARALEQEMHWIHHYLSTGIPLLNQQVSSCEARPRKERKTDAKYGRQFSVDEVHEIIVFRLVRGYWPEGLSRKMRLYYEKHYLTKGGKHYAKLRELRAQARDCQSP